jgi:hypothetical protein
LELMRTATIACLALLLAGPGLAWSQTPSTAPGTTAPPSTSTSKPTAAPPAAARATHVGRTATSGSAALPAGAYPVESEAKAHCPTDTVVWANTSSKAYHMSGAKYYGKTKHGAYMCLKDAEVAGYHGSKAGAVAAKKKTP